MASDSRIKINKKQQKTFAARGLWRRYTRWMTKLKPKQQQRQRTTTPTLNHSKTHTTKGEGTLQFISFRERNGPTNDTRDSNPTPAKRRQTSSQCCKPLYRVKPNSFIGIFFLYQFAFPEELAKPCVSDGIRGDVDSSCDVGFEACRLQCLLWRNVLVANTHTHTHKTARHPARRAAVMDTKPHAGSLSFILPPFFAMCFRDHYSV